jgi:hypothetical protein
VAQVFAAKRAPHDVRVAELELRPGIRHCPPAGSPAADGVLTLFEFLLAALGRCDPGAKVRFSRLDAALALGDPPLLRKQSLLPRLDFLGTATEPVVVLAKLPVSRPECRLTTGDVGLREQAMVLGLLEPPDSVLELASMVVGCGELFARFGSQLAEHGFGAVELSNQMVDARLAFDVAGTELGEPPFAVLELRLLRLGPRDAFVHIRLATLELTLDGVELCAPLLEHVDGTAHDVALDAAAQALAKAVVEV